MTRQQPSFELTSRLMLRLLLAQVLIAVVPQVNGLVSSYFASNFVGIEAMGAVGLYMPLNMLAFSLNTILVGGSTIICGKHMGENQLGKTQEVFSLACVASLVLSVALIILYAVLSLFDLTVIFTRDDVVRPIFNTYLLGQAIGLIPMLFGNAFASFLSIMNRSRRTLIASICYVIANIAFNYIFVGILALEAFGLALATSLGLWVFFLVQAAAFLEPDSMLRIKLTVPRLDEALEVVRVGFPGAASYIYMTARGIIVNNLLEAFVGTVAISAFAASNNLLNIFWAIPSGMLAVSRMLISVSVGEEDRQTLADVMRVMFRRFIPIMCVVSLGIILMAEPFTSIFFQDRSEAVFDMCAWGFRILPLCMPLSIINMHFTCYGQASNKQGLVHLLALLDGVVCVAGFTALLIPALGINSAYIANVLNGVVTTIVIVAYSWIRLGHMPRNMEELMVIPDDFGVAQGERLDLTVRSMEDVVRVSDAVFGFCNEHNIPKRTASYAAVAMEEMAGNIIRHGMTLDSKRHSVDVRVAHKDGDVILRLKDDCPAFDPSQQQSIFDPDDPLKNIGIRMVYKMADEVQYQNILGLNVLTIRLAA